MQRLRDYNTTHDTKYLHFAFATTSLNDLLAIAKQQGGNYSPYNTAKAKVEREIMLIARSQLPHKFKLIGLKKYTCYWIRINRRRDPDNLTIGAKFVLDSLKSAGIIENDGWNEVGAIDHRFGNSTKDSLLLEIEPYEKETTNLPIIGKTEI